MESKMKLLIVSLALIFSIPVGKVSANPEISAEYACLAEAVTGQIIYEYNGHSQHSMASTTKIMTALVALENCSPDELVTVSRNAAYQEGSRAYLAQGEKIKMEDLLYGLLLNSGNDAAVAVAEHVSGTEAAFAQKMTEKAISLGATNTSFKNASGLDAENHYTTAADLAKITGEALKNPTFREIVSRKSKTVDYSGGKLYFSNHNKLLKHYNGCIGVKTGFTKKTGRCLVSAAERDGITLICVTLRASDDWNDHKKLLDYGFENVHHEIIAEKGKNLKNIPTASEKLISAVTAEEITIPLVSGEKRKTELIVHAIPFIGDSVEKGDKIGECEIVYDGRFIKKIDLLAGDEYIKEKTFMESIIDFWKNIFKKN